MDAVVSRLDAALGKVLERQVIAHHRRRLGRVGHGRVLKPPAGGWADASSPPRAGNALDVLVDGAEALPQLAAAIEGARASVWLAGWFFSADFRLRPESEQTLRELLATVAERVDVRVLAWAGAPLPLFHPTRSDVRAARESLVGGTRIAMALDARERPMHCHHEKLAIVDGEVAFVGGIDLTSYAGQRLDHSEHPARGSIGWHDAATRIRGPVVADVAEHFRLRWREVTGETLPSPAPAVPAGDVEVQLVRTVPEKVYDALPQGEFSILESYLRTLRAAERLVYLENQFLWSPEVVTVLADKLRRPPDDRFRLVVLLPAKPNNGNDDTRGQLGLLADADDGAGRLVARTLYQQGEAQPVYVHAKIAVVDDRWLTVGSANLNEHSLFNDTEVNVVTHDARLARDVRLRLWSEHLGMAEGEIAGDPAEVVDELWRRPPSARLQHLPHVSRRSGALLGPLNGLLVDG
jgi:phosphatidylserine/phosphatidylglycerophosphate/cardiolipin synthase-like enzyme